jgi:hypothetical protein
MITPQGLIVTVAGNGQCGSAGDNGPATAAQLAVKRLAIDGSSLLISEEWTNLIRRISSKGRLQTTSQ